MDYSYIFSDLNSEYEDVKLVDHRTSKGYRVKVRINDRTVANTRTGYLTPLLADIVDLATAVFVSDWLLPRKLEKSLDIFVALPVRNPQLLSQSWILKELNDLLKWYTDDKWHFEFRLRNSDMRASERQPKLALFQEQIEVALWSGGLDSLAGLYGRILTGAGPVFTLVGIGNNTVIQGKQIEIVNGLKRDSLPIKLIQLPIQLNYPSVKPPTNDLFRARGFVFKLLGAVCALLEEQQILHVYENGFGAINLPFTAAETGLTHTRSVHPISLIKTGRFISQITSKSFQYKNPYLFMTKTQMCAVLTPFQELAYSTITCDGRYRQADQPTQCGYCSSCLLRRVALLNALGEDQTKYVLTDGIVTQPLLQQTHFKAMNYQAAELSRIFDSENSWQSLLERYPRLRQLASKVANHQNTSAESIQQCLVQLYQAHVREWVCTREKFAHELNVAI